MSRRSKGAFSLKLVEHEVIGPTAFIKALARHRAGAFSHPSPACSIQRHLPGDLSGSAHAGYRHGLPDNDGDREDDDDDHEEEERTIMKAVENFPWQAL